MAENQEEQQAKPKEREIPVFTVLKNNCILKNIFLLDNPPSIPSYSENVDQESEFEEILVVGRHPDCNIKLEHPSISRFHLRIHSNPSFRSLYVTDLSSVHGTWISGKRIEPEVRMKLNEGDSLRLGASSRLYRLNWVPLSRAYDIDDPFVPQLDAADTVDEETDEAIDQVESLCDNLEGLERLFSDEDCGSSMPIASPMPTDLYDSISIKKEEKNSSPEDQNILLDRNDQVDSLSDSLEGLERLLSDEGFGSSVQKTSPIASPMPKDSYDSVSIEEVEKNTSPEDRNILFNRNGQVESLSDILEGLERLFSDEGFGLSVQKTGPIAPLMPKDLYDSVSIEVEKNTSPEDQNILFDRNGQVESLSDNLECLRRLFSDEGFGSSVQKTSPIASPMPKDSYDSVSIEQVEKNTSPEDQNILFDRNGQVESLSDNLESLERLFSDEGFGSSVQKTSPIASAMPKESYDSVSVEVKKNSSPEDQNILFDRKGQVESPSDNLQRLFSEADFGWSMQNPLIPVDLYDSVSIEVEKNTSPQDQNILFDGNDQVESLSDNLECLERLFSDKAFDSAVQKMTPIASPMPKDSYDSVSIEEVEKNTSPEDHNILFDRNAQVESLSDNLERLVSDVDFGRCMQNPLMPIDLYDSVSIEELEKNRSPGLYSQENELSISQPCQFEKEHGTPVSLLETTETYEMNSDKKSGLSICSRRGKLLQSVQIETNGCKRNISRIKLSSQFESFSDENHKSESVLKDLDNEEENFTPQKENASQDSFTFKSPKSTSEKRLNGLILNTPISSLDRDEEIFTPDKENMTPNTRLFRSVKNIVGKNPNSSHRPSPLKIAYTKVFQELKPANSVASKRHGSSKKKPVILKARTNRVPLRSLPVESPGSNHKTSSKSLVFEDMLKGSKSIKFPEFEENNAPKVAVNRWIIFADTTSLLNKKSRNELQLLRGLRKTTLVIPKIVVRELDCMLRRGSSFTRRSEVSAALQYIEESMAVAKWWIHVQSSNEEGGRLLPPTPPAACWLGKGMWQVSIGSSTPLSPCSLQEIVTPTAGDHVLDYAMHYKGTIRKDERLVLLTDDVTLKIKAMAEGVLCETANEFRRSLVNPFSARFLYSNCSPIGPTWSCADDVVLKEKYYPSPSKKVVSGSESGSGDGAKGLKLVLMHNSSFRHQIKPVSSIHLL